MKTYGFRIRNQSEHDAVLRYGRMRLAVPAYSTVEGLFPLWFDPAMAVDELGEVMAHLAASVCAELGEFEFEAISNEFGYKIFLGESRVFDIELLDPEPHRYAFADGTALTTGMQAGDWLGSQPGNK